MRNCPKCRTTIKQRKIGRTEAGSQRYQCGACGRRYSPEAKQHGYDDSVRRQAVQLALDGMNFRRIARHLGVSHQSVSNWLNAHSAQLPAQPPQPENVGVVELDEVFTFIEKKKTPPIS